MSSEWLTTVEVAELLGRSDRWVRDRIKDGRLPAVSGGGGQRKSYKINKEALAVLLATEGKTAPVAELLEGVGEEKLSILADAVQKALSKGRRVIVVEKCEAIYRPIGDMMKKLLPAEFIYGEAPYRKYFDNPAMQIVAAYDRASGKVEGVLTVAVTSMDFYEELLKGTAKDDYHPSCQKGQTPVVCLDTLILENPEWAPWIFRSMGEVLRRYAAKNGLTLAAAFGVATAPAAVAMLENFGFKKVGMFGKFPVLACKDIAQGKLGRSLA